VGLGGTGGSAVERFLWTGGVGELDVDLRAFAVCDVRGDGDMVENRTLRVRGLGFAWRCLCVVSVMFGLGGGRHV